MRTKRTLRQAILQKMANVERAAWLKRAKQKKSQRIPLADFEKQVRSAQFNEIFNILKSPTREMLFVGRVVVNENLNINFGGTTGHAEINNVGITAAWIGMLCAVEKGKDA